MGCFSRFSGWKLTAVYLTILVSTLTTLLFVTLFVSLFGLKRDDGDDVMTSGRDAGDALGQSVLYKGNCDTTAKANLWIHLLINIVSTGILASSNFFMQGLVAPTRAEVDAAHRSGHWLEIGVQSLKNFRFLGWRKVLFWSLFSMSSVPLHLVFNGCVLESKGTNGFTVMIGSPELVQGGWKGLPSITQAYYDRLNYSDRSQGNGNPESLEKLKPINDSFVVNQTDGNWVEMYLPDCIHRYNNPQQALTHWRHLMMIIYDFDDIYRNETVGWKRADVLLNTTNTADLNVTNPLWTVDAFTRTGRTSEGSGSTNQYLSNPGPSYLVSTTPDEYGYTQPGSRSYMTVYGTWDMQGTRNIFDPQSGAIITDPRVFKTKYRVMQVDRCYSEKYEAPCRLSIANSLLLIVCIMCLFKTVLCLLVLKLRVWGDESPLMTPGDAIASFISRPDEETRGMCTLTMDDLRKTAKPTPTRLGEMNQNYKWLQGPRQWQNNSPRRFGKAVPRNIWVLSSLLIGSSLIVASVMLSIAINGQSLSDSKFMHAPQNEDVKNNDLDNLPLISLTMVANTPQLILSICYLAYNGLFTRMLAEFEWSKYSVEFRSLRVTEPRGSQNATYRLQLPYRFSIPLIIISIGLHWIYSNCIYVSNYEAYAPGYPYKRDVTVGLQFSSKAILVGLLVSIGVAITPLFLAFVKLPGVMVIAGANSAVISAACHYPSTKLKSLSRATSKMSMRSNEYDSMSARLIGDEEVEELRDVSRRKIKWGRMSMGKSDESSVGHLGFGTEELDIEKPVEGEYYSGVRDVYDEGLRRMRVL
ncbi:hypothetical protein FVEG_13636 [Fusarium verticillioides 7600]|uniref:DUF6536 domain-containing protein n=1 Tax=Gibberella moniliformis (strain M3125 / FGSC 7600) TaxID=334819 RepID=W7N6F5_GIBM7|nr:hypothetical protein FVEG_13636 [Fusarium verticillioides 7600]EWG55665.1 hypothetical protein FVEG_13636 [Fusarium verticillioides 7600]